MYFALILDTGVCWETISIVCECDMCVKKRSKKSHWDKREARHLVTTEAYMIHNIQKNVILCNYTKYVKAVCFSSFPIRFSHPQFLKFYLTAYFCSFNLYSTCHQNQCVLASYINQVLLCFLGCKRGLNLPHWHRQKPPTCHFGRCSMAKEKFV